ncbi:MAG: TIGR02266 family protein [Kofleriaceae bacterium]|nr:TIGR02266 family protein [Kofleriaceae bacterium]
MRLLVDYDDADDFLKDYTENLSTGGTFILTNRTFERDTNIQLVLSFPGLVQPLALEGVVRWARGGAHPGIGVEFVSVDDRARLDALVTAVQAGDVRTVARVVRVLVAEDNPHVAELICTGLGASAKRFFGDTLQFQCATAPTGANALELLRTMTFDVAIIDLYMPLVDGTQVIGHAREELGLVDLPIIATSAGGELERKSALTAGANEFLEKPMRLRSVIESMRRLVPLGSRAAS